MMLICAKGSHLCLFCCTPTVKCNCCIQQEVPRDGDDKLKEIQNLETTFNFIFHVIVLEIVGP